MKKGLRTKVLIGSILVVSHFTAIFLASPFIINRYLYSENTFEPLPEIDTVFTDGFSKKEFQNVSDGMTYDEVKKLLGEPFRKEGIKIVSPAPDNTGKIIGTGETFRPQDNAECWYYSKDGALQRADFSWFSYRVCFEDNKMYLKSVTEHGD